ncbi:MAG: hypothetical protein MUE69_33180 [Myxococcota bacterium]|jgi:hypothetical protein|nr:hypothetical protein [Myxococcota bacterium]
MPLAVLLGLFACGDDDGSTPPVDGGSRDGGTRDASPVDAASARDAEPEGDASTTGWLRDRYPGDEGLADDPAVLFHDDFESGWGRWDAPTADTAHLFLETGGAHAGERFLRATVTHDQLLEDEYISASPRVAFPRRVDEMYWRLHVRFVGVAPNPHHWIRVAAGTEAFRSSGLANTVPDGDEGFWFDFDANLDDSFQFYAYWHAMRSGRCNDGSATPGCAGDQGTTYYYGNVFRPAAEQNRFERDAWTCVELAARANTVGESDGALSAWIDDRPIGEFGPGTPIGTWLRSTFHPGGCEFSACTEPVPFEGFEFRTSDDVRFKEIFLDAYYERGSWEDRRDRMRELGLDPGEESTIHYDDVVVATERIGCRL